MAPATLFRGSGDYCTGIDGRKSILGAIIPYMKGRFFHVWTVFSGSLENNMNQRAAEQEIWKLIQGVFDAFEGRDVGGMEDLLHEDCTLWDVFEPELISGRAEREAFHQRDKAQSMARGRLSISVHPLKLDIFQEVAVARYWLQFNYQPPNATSGRVRITDVLLRRPDGWRIMHHHEGMAPQGAPPTDE